MWHLHWQADTPRRSRPVERVRTTSPATLPTATDDDVSSRGSFQVVWQDTPAGSLAAEIPETVRVRGR